MTAANLVVWRHGQTDWNVSGRFQGHADIGLNETGRAQAAAAARYLATLAPDEIWASDLSRAAETAGALAALTGLKVKLDKRFREIDVGEWRGLTDPEVEARQPGVLRDLSTGVDTRRSATGETAAEVGARVAAALDEVARAAPDSSTLVVATHGLAARMGIATLLGLDYAGALMFAIPGNCAWAVLQPSRQHPWRVRSYNCSVRDGAP